MCELRKQNGGQRTRQGHGESPNQGKQMETFHSTSLYRSLFLNCLRCHMLLLEAQLLHEVIF